MYIQINKHISRIPHNKVVLNITKDLERTSKSLQIINLILKVLHTVHMCLCVEIKQVLTIIT